LFSAQTQLIKNHEDKHIIQNKGINEENHKQTHQQNIGKIEE